MDSLKSFNRLIGNFSDSRFDYGGYYIILFQRANRDEVSEIFQTLWKLYIYNVNFIRIRNNSIIIETFLPFTSSECNQTNPIKIAEYQNGNLTMKFGEFFPDKFMNFHKCPLKVTTFETVGPAVLLRENFSDGTYRLHGRDIDMLNTIAERFNFMPDIFYNKTYGGWGVIYPNGSGSGGFYAAKIRTTDVLVGNLNLRVDRIPHISHSVPYAEDVFIFIIPHARPWGSLEKLFYPFDFFVWTSLLIVMVIGFIIIAILENQSNIRLRNFVIGSRVTSPCMNMLIAVFGASQRVTPKRNFARYILMLFLIFCLVIRSLYQGALFQFLQSSNSYKEPQTIEEMANLNYTFYMIFPYAEFTKDNLLMRGRRVAIDAEFMKVLMLQVLDSNFKGTLMSKMSQVVYSNRYRSKHNEELYKICKERYMMIPITMYYPKNSYLVKPFNRMILRLHSSGLMNYWQSINEEMKYLNFKAAASEPKRLTFDHLSGIFKIWIVACGASAVVFAVEVISYKRKIFASENRPVNF